MTNATARCHGAKCELKFFLFFSGDYRVLATDYDSYAVIYKCEDYLFAKKETVWLYSRRVAIDSVSKQAANTAISKVTDFNLETFYFVPQGGGCFYYPGYRD